MAKRNKDTRFDAYDQENTIIPFLIVAVFVTVWQAIAFGASVLSGDRGLNWRTIVMAASTVVPLWLATGLCFVTKKTAWTAFVGFNGLTPLVQAGVFALVSVHAYQTGDAAWGDVLTKTLTAQAIGSSIMYCVIMAILLVVRLFMNRKRETDTLLLDTSGSMGDDGEKTP